MKYVFYYYSILLDQMIYLASTRQRHLLHT